MDKKYQVFISSTYEDLKIERSEVAKTILEFDCIPSGMEVFCSEADEQFEIIKGIIDLCDYYVLVIANRYGSVEPKQGKSFTELEFEYACSKGIPVLAFFGRDVPDKPSDGQETKLELFKSNVSENRMVSFWSSKDELAKKVAVALSKAIKKNDRVGWVKGDESEAEIERLKEAEKERDSLKKELNETKSSLSNAQATIKTLTEFNGELLFDQRPLKIDYKNGYRYSSSKSITIKAIFQRISVHFINVSYTESKVLEFIREAVDEDCSHLVPEIMEKKICMQLIALNLFSTEWSDERKALFYSLTKKGIKLRDELNLFTV